MENELLAIKTLNEVPVIDSRIVAEELDNSHSSLLRLINNHLPTIEANFGRVGFEIVPLSTKGGTQKGTIAYLTEDQAIFIGSLSKNTAKVVQFKAKLVKSFAKVKQALTKVAPTLSPLQILEMQVELMKQQDNRIQTVEAKVSLIEARINTSDQDYFTISGYCRLNGYKVSNSQAASIGKLCSRASHVKQIPVGKIKDTRFGHVNTYHMEILDSVIPLNLIK
jgi:phage regulator Rha-like protein